MSLNVLKTEKIPLRNAESQTTFSSPKKLHAIAGSPAATTDCEVKDSILGIK